jgi:type IV secretion system protein VirB10
MSELKEINIDETRGKVQRNLHLWLIGILAIVVAVFMTIISMNDKPRVQEEEEIKVENDIETQPEQLKKILDDQEQSADQYLVESIDPTVYALPTAATEGVRTGPEQNGLTEEEIERRKREAMIAQSGILVIDMTQNRGVENFLPTDAIPPGIESQLAKMAESDAALQREIMNEINSGIGAEQAPVQQPLAVPPASVYLDRQWAEQQQSLPKTEKIREDGLNPEYTIFQGSIIPAVLISKINSDLPGQIIAQTTQDVYDGVRGQHLIIPKGSKIYGVYNNDINAGQGKIMVAFQRIVMPGGRSITLPGLPGMDSIGQSGMSGDVNNHYFQLYGGSALVAAISAIVDHYGKNNTNVAPEGPSVGSQVTSASGQVLVDVSRNMLQRNNNVRPTITINHGEKFNILVNRDIEVLPHGSR